jgi:hypothetical protein
VSIGPPLAIGIPGDGTDVVQTAAEGSARTGQEILDGRDGDEIHVRPTDGTRFGLRFVPVAEPKSVKNPIHLDLLGDSVEHQRRVVDRLVGPGRPTRRHRADRRGDLGRPR